ncbi:pseudouridine synthase [Hathewaya histolytica]|uniref:pseudouridine synthase n=1 Tax=Hathewaya histolytica TaxID=1498 RepID=UPI0018D9ADB1|nr:pseudouridine synthase [Hathewaya histolytica]
MYLERLQKYMAECGIASRRKCEFIILEGRVKVNGLLEKELGVKVDPIKDIIEVDNKVIKKEENKVYIMLNKPIKYVTTVKDEKDRNTVLDLVNVKERIYPIGRLDYMTSGILLLTNDGDIYNKIIHPRREVDKTYIAKIKGIPTKDEIKTFENGVDIGGYITAKSKLRILNKRENDCTVEIKIHEGKNRQIRRMCDSIGHPVITLKRISIGDIVIGDLKEGKWRNLTYKELEYIRSL